MTVDPSAALARARSDARRIVTGFRTRFALGSLAAVVAGACLVLLVRKTDQVAAERARFAASAAHELRTPLAGMRLYGEMLADGMGQPGSHAHYARRIAAEAERLGRVVSNVLEFSSLERGGLRVRPEPGDLADPTRRSVERLRPAVEAHGAAIELDIASGLPPVCFDADAVHQILQNLVDNAEKYSRGAEDRTIRVALEPDRSGVRLSVSDRGRGVDRSVARSLFDPFTRSADPEAPAGLGIGLALVQALARAQQATVDHTQASGGGACFTVRFVSPAATAGAAG